MRRLDSRDVGMVSSSRAVARSMRQMFSPTAAEYRSANKSNMSPPENFEQAKRRLYSTPLKSAQSLNGGGGNVRTQSLSLSTLDPLTFFFLRAGLTVIFLVKGYDVQGDSRQEYGALLKEHDHAISRRRPQETPSKGPDSGQCSAPCQQLWKSVFKRERRISMGNIHCIDFPLFVTEPIVLDAAPKLSPPSGNRAERYAQRTSSSRPHTPQSLNKTKKSSDFGLSDELRRKIQSVDEKSRRALRTGEELEIKSLEVKLKILEFDRARQKNVRAWN